MEQRRQGRISNAAPSFSPRIIIWGIEPFVPAPSKGASVFVRQLSTEFAGGNVPNAFGATV